MPTPNVLELTVQSFTANQLAIKVKNISGVALEKTLRLNLTLPEDLATADIDNAAKEGAEIENPPGMANVTTLVTGSQGWTVWVMGDTSESVVVLMFFNSRDQDWKQLNPPTKLEADADFTILIPLKSHTGSAGLQIPYMYKHGPDTDGPPVSGTLALRPPDPIEWRPNVTLTTNQTSPTMIKPGKEVEISWEIDRAVSATLRGPLPGGNTEWSLSNNRDSEFSMHKGLFKIKAVGPMTYILQAEVSRPDGGSNVQVVKMLSLDIYSSAKYGFVSARSPRRVLPFGLVEVDWAAWGVKSVILETDGASREIALTDMSVTGFLQGVGVMRITAGRVVEEKTVPVTLNVELDELSQVPKTDYKVVPWKKLESNFKGKPVGLAVAVPKLALLTTAGLWITEVGRHDPFAPVEELEFTQIITDQPKAWLAIAALGSQFVVLRQTNQDDLQVALYNSDGSPSGIPPLDLPGLRPLMTSGAVFDLAVYGVRAYVAVESLSQGLRCAFSVGFTDKAEYRNEILLERFLNYRLLTFDDALFALNRDSGEMVRFELEHGKLEPYQAASAVDEQGASMVKQGLLVPVGHVLAVLTPTSVPSLKSLQLFGLKNVLPYKNLSPPRSGGKIEQDLVYNPQDNRWSRCGHGLDIKEGVVAFRGGASPRLWVIGPDDKTYTLTVQSEHLFVQNYVKGKPADPLPPVFNKTRELMFINNTGMEFVPMNETCLKAGLRPFSATGVAHLSSPLPTGPTNPKRAESVELRYNDAAPPPTATLRMLAKRGPGVKHEYVLEVTLSGPRFSNSSICFKRLTPDAQGGVSITEVPGKLEDPVALGLIERFPRQLSNGIRLRIRNVTPYKLWLRSPDATDPLDHEKQYDEQEGIKIKYNTPPFSIYLPGVGELPVDVDFALPNGIEISPSTEVQKYRIRIKHDGPRVFYIEGGYVTQTSEYDAYECRLRYKIERSLKCAYLGDGVPLNDGTSIYLPVVVPPNVTNAKILKIDANTLQTTAEASVAARNFFSSPNSVGVLSDRVIAMFDGQRLKVFDHALKFKTEFPIALFEFDIITNLKGSPDTSRCFMLGTKEQPTWQFKRSYKIDFWWLYEPMSHQLTAVVDFFKLNRRSRVPDAPPWVAPNTISPMDVGWGSAMAICVEGGIIGYDLRRNWVEIDVELPGTGREEAIVVDPTEHLIFCAHSKPSGPGLMISRINAANPSDKRTVELSGPVTSMVTDPRPVTGPNLEYHCPRSVSLRATSDLLFVSLSRKICIFDKTTLQEKTRIDTKLPVRLIQVRRATGENQNCYIVWAIGSKYEGDGQNVKEEDYGKSWETVLYKIAMVP